MKILVINHVTLDGVMQSPGGPDEDRRGGFQHGGWALPDNDDVMGKAMGERMARGGGGLLLGRFTYQALYDYWPKQKNNPYTEVLNRTPKYVTSRTLKEPLPWENSTLLPGDAAEAVTNLKQQAGKDLTVLGSGELLQTLIGQDLIDEYLLMIHPRLLGSGRRLFPEGTSLADLHLVDCTSTSKGVLLATYRPTRKS